MPNQRGRFTGQERQFVAAMAETGNARYAAAQAGYRSTSSAIEVAARPAVQAAIRERELAVLHNELLPLSNRVLREALTEKAVPWGAKIKAVDLVHKRTFGEDAAANSKAPSEMTPAELAEALDKLKSELADRSRPAVLELEPEPGEQEDNPKTNVFG